MEPIWLETYPENMPTTIDVSSFGSLSDCFERSCEKFAHNNAVTNMGFSLSYTDLERLSRHFATYLKDDIGLQKGERFAIMMPNILQYFVAIFAALRAGLVVVNINPLYTKRELMHQLKDSGAKAIIVLEHFAHKIEQTQQVPDLEHIIITRLGDVLPAPKSWLVNFTVKYIKRMIEPYEIPNAQHFSAALKSGASKTWQPVEITQQDLAFLQYTGGTTGKPKAAMLSHGNLVANVHQSLRWSDGAIGDASEVMIVPLPLYHILSLMLCCFAVIQSGNEAVLITNPRDLEGMMKRLRKVRFTIFAGINTLYNAMLQSPYFDQVDWSHLHIAISGGAATTKVVAEAWHQRTGVPILEGYGLTETSPVVTINRFDLTQYTGSIGLPVPGTQLDLQNDSGDTVPIGEVGELCVKGPQVMQGYWHSDSETKIVIDGQGWLHTGDMARLDERGYVYLVDRKKDMVLVSGFNVYPNEIRNVLMSHPGVLEAAVIGVPDDETGEKVKAVVVKKDPALTEAMLVAHCKENLTNYKRPKLYEFRTELPKTAVGKVLRRTLREQHSEQTQGKSHV